MEEKSAVIFGNQIDKKTLKKAEKNKQKYLKKFGDDSKKVYHLKPSPIPCLADMGVKNLVLSEEEMKWEGKPLIVGNIRMGFGHYRISIAMASCAKALGYDPYWLDLASFDATGSAMIRYQNDLYSTASRISQKSKLFNKFFWEPLNSEGFKKLTYNASDQKAAELLVPLFHDIPKGTPYIATHVWPSQGAVHAGMDHVVNAIPDNWPMALHLSEGAIHTVQTPFAYLGYKMLHGFDKKPLKGIPDGDLYMTGHYVDHELVNNIEKDTELRIKRIENGEPLRILLSVGGAGAGAKLFGEMIAHLLPYVKDEKVALFLNFGDHQTMYDYLCKNVKGFQERAICYFDRYQELTEFVDKMDEEKVSGVYAISNKEIFEAVYSTNLLMRKCEVLITKPSELAYYPIYKIMMRHIGGHEVYGAIHGQEFGDSTWECGDKKEMSEMLDRLLSDKGLLIHLMKEIVRLKATGLYDGGYEVVKLAVEGRR